MSLATQITGVCLFSMSSGMLLSTGLNQWKEGKKSSSIKIACAGAFGVVALLNASSIVTSYEEKPVSQCTAETCSAPEIFEYKNPNTTKPPVVYAPNP